MQTGLPCMMMRGGTSKGAYFLAADLPADPALRDRVLLAVMGSPDARQIDGIGGATSLTSKVAVISPSADPDIDVDTSFCRSWSTKPASMTARTAATSWSAWRPSRSSAAWSPPRMA